MYRADDPDRAVGVVDGAEGGLGEKGAGALESPPRVTAVSRVLIDRSHRERVQRLQQQGPHPTDEHRRVAVHAIDGRVGTVTARPDRQMYPVASSRTFLAGDAFEDHLAHALLDRTERVHLPTVRFARLFLVRSVGPGESGKENQHR